MLVILATYGHTAHTARPLSRPRSQWHRFVPIAAYEPHHNIRYAANLSVLRLVKLRGYPEHLPVAVSKVPHVPIRSSKFWSARSWFRTVQTASNNLSSLDGPSRQGFTCVIRRGLGVHGLHPIARIQCHYPLRPCLPQPPCLVAYASMVGTSLL